MTTFYDHQKLEKKWQERWEKSGQNQAGDLKGDLPAQAPNGAGPTHGPAYAEPRQRRGVAGKAGKQYILDMFSYPSADGLHVGHPESYTATDIMARYYRYLGYNVLHPVGFDAFGLPAENYAIKQGVHPKIKTAENIENFRRQIKSLGFSYDWSREVNTSSPDYYRWTQWLFLQLYKKGLAYKKQAPVNWCNSCKTVLANEQVVDKKCERCENEVVQKNLEQWFFKVTDYAEELLEKIDGLDWSEALKATQKNWIGKSEGVLIKFQIQNQKNQELNKSKIKNQRSKIQNSEIEVFTTRPDTLFGATYLVLAPEHEIIKNLRSKIENWEEVEKYINQAKSKNKLERTDLAKEKTGVELAGVKAVNPATKKEIPVWLADYVLTDYGTGAIMAVPAHDERDFEFAKKFNLEIIKVIENNRGEDCYAGEGRLINSGKFDGLNLATAGDKITKFVGGKKQVQYKIRDWLVSRQRYWGAPIPIIYCRKCWENSKSKISKSKQISNSNYQNSQVTFIDGLEYMMVPVPEKDLPVLLPDDVDFKPTGESPLKSSKSFNNVKCPKCGGTARREADTMDTFVCSAWYFLRYADARNQQEAFSKKAVKYWLPVDLYIGGMEHAVGHLIYSRFIVKALRDMGHLNFDEPFLKMRNQGIILAEDGRKMSKRWGNVINPDEVVEAYGADTIRIYEMFMGPLEDMKPWSQQGIIGVRRFLEKTYKFINQEQGTRNKEQGNELEKLLHKTIKKVTEDIEELKFNTAISAMMIFINKAAGSKSLNKEWLEKFLIILSPFAPHLAEELWESLGRKESIFYQRWPEYDKNLIIDEEVMIVVQINGKVRDNIKVQSGINEKDLRPMIYNLSNIKKYIEGKKIKKVVYVKDKLINIVI